MTCPAPAVRRCPPSEVLALRHQVLRPHQRLEEVRFGADDEPRAAHFCATDADGRVVAVASTWPEAPPWDAPAPGPQWRLRGMATSPEWRGKGVGMAVLEAVIGHVAAEGGGFLWCNARLPAVGFYERAGMTVTGEPWEEPVIGPHVAMWRLVVASGHGGGQLGKRRGISGGDG